MTSPDTRRPREEDFTDTQPSRRFQIGSSAAALGLVLLVGLGSYLTNRGSNPEAEFDACGTELVASRADRFTAPAGELATDIVANCGDVFPDEVAGSEIFFAALDLVQSQRPVHP